MFTYVTLVVIATRAGEAGTVGVLFLKLLIVAGIGRSTGPCIISVIRGLIHDCVNYV